MSEPRGAMAMQFPRPGKVLRAVLWGVAALGVFWALAGWVPGGDTAAAWMVFNPSAVLHGQIWRLLTAGLVLPSGPGAVSHLLFLLVGLYFLSTDLETRWGGRRFGFFLATCLVTGYVLALAVSRLPFGGELFHPLALYGMDAAVTGTAVAWSRENANREVRLFFVLPVKGRYFLWLTIGWCVLGVLFKDGSTEGVVVPFGGVIAGLFFGGSPSPIRTAYLNWKLASLRKQTGGLSAQAMLQPATKRKAGGPPLRVVQGGLDEDPPKREPPRDKRWLN
jgi:membrane associated rhomboid family serine protease